MKKKVYCIGLKASEKLECENEEIFSYYICKYGEEIIINCKSNEYKFLEKQVNLSKDIVIRELSLLLKEEFRQAVILTKME